MTGRGPSVRGSWWVVIIAVAVLVALGVGVILSQRVADQTTPLMEQTAQIAEVDKRIAAQKDLLQYQTDNQVKIWTTLAQATLAVAAGIGGYFTWRNLRVAQDGQITNRFTQAITQLGADLKDGSPNLEFRLGAIYALERIAKDSERDHGPIMEILTEYVRHNASFNGGNPKPLRPDVQAILNVIGRRTRYYSNGELERLNLARTDLRNSKLQHAHLEGLYLWDTHFEGADMQWVHLEKARLGGAYLHGARLWDAHLNGSRLRGAHLEGADFTRAVLTETQLEGVDLSGALGIKNWEQVQAAFYDERTRFPVNIEDHRKERAHPSPPGYGD